MILVCCATLGVAPATAMAAAAIIPARNRFISSSHAGMSPAFVVGPIGFDRPFSGDLAGREASRTAWDGEEGRLRPERDRRLCAAYKTKQKNCF
jgi:hypothetical protein